MDLPRSRNLDGLTRRAADHFHAPMAFMSILDDRHVFHAAAHGMGDEPDASRSDAVEASYCQFVVALDEVLVVNDSLEDELVGDHPATRSGEVRAYLGVPIRSGEECLGSFCVVDQRPREWTAADVDALREFADAAMRSPEVVLAARPS